MDFRFYFSLFLRRLHYFLLFLAIGSAAGITLATVLPPVYEAEAEMLWESATIDEAASISAEAREQLQIIQQRVLTRENILEMVNRLDVYGERAGTATARLAPDEKVADMRSRIRVSVTGGEDRRGPTTATVARVGFASSTADLAANVTNEVVDLMLAENLRMRTIAAGGQVEFRRDRERTLGRQLSEQEAVILRFQQENLETLPGQESFLRSQQLAAQTRGAQLAGEDNRLREQQESIIRICSETGGDLAAVAGPQTTEAQQLTALETELSTMLLTLSETHPNVVLTKGRIEALRAVVTQQQANAGQIAPGGEQLSECDLRQIDIEAQLDFISRQQDLVVAELTQLQEKLDAVPANRVALDAMQRDYNNIRAQYDGAVAALAEAETIQVLELTGAGEKLTVIENAQAPGAPTSPNRPVIAAAGVGGGLALGLGFIVLLELLTSAIRRPVDLTKKLGITPLGTIPHIRTQWEIVRRRMIILGIFTAVLIALPAALWFIHTNITPLDMAINGVLNRLGLPLI